jgi:hypothetical protein
VHPNIYKQQNRPTPSRCTLGRDLRVLLPQNPSPGGGAAAREKGSHSNVYPIKNLLKTNMKRTETGLKPYREVSK